ncbi:MAG: PSD1 and planctomycete cytochrome C domain-containing protein [Gemmataceae bacterium]
MASCFRFLWTWLSLAAFVLVPAAVCANPDDHFEKKVRPLLLSQCISCHGPEKVRGGLRLDSADGVAKGGDSGPVVRPGKPEESLLIRAVQHDGDLKMPPKGKLKDQEVRDLVVWVRAGATWPKASAATPSRTPQTVAILEPNAAPLRPNLQAWYRADKLPLSDGKPVHVWPDSSGKGRDLAATEGVRTGGVGKPGTFVSTGTVNGRAAVRFTPETGFASSPDVPVDIKGDAALTLMVVVNLKPTESQPPYDGILGVGNPASPGNPGKPKAALIQIARTGEPELMLAGGWGHDATLGKGSFGPLWNRPLVMTVVKKPGPMRASTRIFVDGVPVEESPLKRKVEGVDGIPDIQHRDDIGLYLGKALAWSGSIRGDVSEAIVFNAALGDEQRTAVELGLMERYGVLHPSVLAQSKATFTREQKAFWAFQPVKAVTPPQVGNEAWVKSPVDRFILARLEAAGLTPAAPADKRTLIRRVTYDLTGLPPTPEQVDSFLKDTSPEAFARVVDRLLESPHYGERWGRHWLDVGRYAETTANDANAVMRYAWRYRDYVVRAFNTDKPYDRFVIEQLAGDLLPPGGDLTRDAESVIATGFLMIGPKALAETDKEQSRRDIIDDQLDTTGRAFLGLTLGCARCHDHKFDPIPTVDYYSLAGILRGSEVFQNEVRNATMWEERTLLHLPGEQPVVVMAPRDLRPTNLRVAIRGNYQTPGMLTPRRFLQIIAGEGHAPITSLQSGRLELARWIASKDNPLTARVMVNRVWQHHFGVGLVATSDNFGARGEKPSHPELLDWLAGEFVANGWSVKKLHRLMILSSTYQTGSRSDERSLKVDPNNRFLGRTERRRLDAESLRDSVLLISGRLDSAIGGNDSGELLAREGENIGAKILPNRVQTDHPIFTTSTRRSLYLPVIRNAVPDVFALFDGADPNGVTAMRNETTVASQALFLLNHPFVREQSAHFARRLLAGEKANADRITTAYRLALGREPSEAEIHSVSGFLAEHQKKAAGRKPEEARLAAWQSFCQTLFCRNEFLYLD